MRIAIETGNDEIIQLLLKRNKIEIGKDAFRKCASLEQLEIPSFITSIGDFAFYECESLRKLTIPNSIKSIGKAAFYKCLSLKSLFIHTIL